MPEQLPITLNVSLESADAEAVIVRWLRDYAATAGRPRFVLGLSGGLDSSVAAVLGAKALGGKHVHGFVLPEAATPRSDLEDAAEAARHAGIPTTTVSIQPFVDALRQLPGPEDRAVLANAKARFRMVLLHAEAHRQGALVLGTGNKSELLTGYFTKYGDGGVDVQPLGDLYKTQVRLLARHLNVPARIQNKPPSAGLWVGQTDEGELGLPYAQLDRVLLGFELHLDQARIAQAVGVQVGDVERLEHLRAATQHKRRAPLSPKIGLRTVGLDWRAPVQEG